MVEDVINSSGLGGLDNNNADFGKGKLEQQYRCLWEKIVALLRLGEESNL